MRTKVTLVLLALNLALAAFIVFYELPSRQQAGRTDTRRVLGPETAAIRILEIASPTATLRLERSGDAWHLTSPVQWPANDFALTRILNELRLLEHETSFTVADIERNGQALADYGLAEPRLTLTYTADTSGTDSPAPAVTLRIGGDTTVGNRLYVLTDDDRIHVVSRSLAESLALTLAQLRSDAIFTIPVFEVRSFNLQAAEGARVRVRRDGARWSFEAPIVARAAKTATELTINDLNALRVHRFLDAPADRTGLNAPLLRVTLEGNSRRETLLIGRPVADTPPPDDAATVEHYARLDDRPASLFTVQLPSELLKKLTTAQTALRERRLLDFDPANVTAIVLDAPAGRNLPELTLQRLDSGTDATWQILRRDSSSGPSTAPADTTLVANLLQRLALLEATAFHRDAPSEAELEDLGFNLLARTVTLQFAPNSGRAEPLTLELARTFGATRSVYARVAGQPFIYAVSPEILHNTPVAAGVWRDRALDLIPPGTAIVGLQLSTADRSETLYLRTLGDGESWTDALATEPEARRTALQALLDQLPKLRAGSIVREIFPDTVIVNDRERPWAWRLDITLARDEADAEPLARTLFIAQRGGGGEWQLGSPHPALDLVFTAEQSLIDALWPLLYPRDPAAQ